MTWTPAPRVRALAAAVLAGLMVAGLACLPVAHGSGDADDSSEGASLYRVYCTNCHGATGKGDGPTSAYLNIEPTDLTRLAAENRGTFPRERVRRSVDGRDRVRAHGAREMPIWGLALQEWDQDSNQEEEVRIKIDLLVRYLESIQVDD